MEENGKTANSFSATNWDSLNGATDGKEGEGHLKKEGLVNPRKEKKEDQGCVPKAFGYFFVVVCVTSSFMLGMLFVQNKRVSQAHERIIQEFERAANPDTTQLYSIESFKSLLDASGLSDIEKVWCTVLGETLIKDIIQSVEANATQDGRVQALLLETKGVIEVELSRIQQEYESMQIWYGLLTVVFLLFSFFSLYKTDELVGKCMEIETNAQREMREVIKSIWTTKEKTMVEIKQYKQTARAELKASNSDVIKSYSEKVVDFETRLKQMESQIDDYSSTMETIKKSILDFDK